MLVKNWMLPQQYSISSDALAVEAVMLIREHNLKMLPVVDDGRLRGGRAPQGSQRSSVLRLAAVAISAR